MRICVCAILLKDERLMLGKRAAHKKTYANKWDVIGGHVEEGESPEEALVRELREEVGVRPVGWESLCSIRDNGSESEGQATYLMFVVRAWTGGEPVMANDEHSALMWFTPAEACALADLALAQYRSVFRMICF